MISDINPSPEVRRSAHQDGSGNPPAGAHPSDREPVSPGFATAPVDRRGAVAAFAFAALFIVGLLLVASTPEYSVPDNEYEAWFEDGANRTGQLIGVIALVLAGFCFLPLARAASDWVRRGRDSAEHTFDIVLAAIFMTLVTVGGLITGHGSVAVEIGDTPVPSADVVRSGEQIGYGVVLFAASLVAAWLIGRLAITARRTGSAPNWFVLLSAVTAVALIFGSLFIPVVLLPVWAVATGLALLRRPQRPAA